MSIFYLCLIFVAGILVATLVTWYTRAVMDRRPLVAATTSGVLALMNLCVVGLVFALTEDRGPSILAYAGGNWVGTYMTVRRV